MYHKNFQEKTGANGKDVAILLCTKNGAAFLEEQLESYRCQTHINWRLYISDDGSTDDTIELIKRFASTVPNPVDIRFGPRQGFVQNFLSILLDTTIRADYFAYSDQDDIWMPDKLERAVAWHESIPQDKPALYCARAKLMSADGIDAGLSPLFSKSPGFKNALVENIASGNTSVFNSSARDLLLTAGKVSVAAHDWWTYLLVTGCGGRVWYDPQPCVKYRQHKGNTIGVNHGMIPAIRRIRRLWRGTFKSNIDRNLNALKILYSFDGVACPEAKEVLELFKKTRTSAGRSRLVQLRESGVYRQRMLENMGLIMAAVFKMI